MDQQTQSSKQVSNMNLEKTDSGGWTCMMCIRSRKTSGQISSASTTEDLTQSSTDPTDTSSLKEYIDLYNLNRKQDAPPPQVSDDQKSGTWTCIKKCLSCQVSDTQEPTETYDEITQSSSDPTDFSASSMKEGIEMDVLGPVQQEPSALADIADSGDFHEETSNLQLEQHDTSSKQDAIDGTNPISSNLALETEV